MIGMSQSHDSLFFYFSVSLHRSKNKVSICMNLNGRLYNYLNVSCFGEMHGKWPALPINYFWLFADMRSFIPEEDRPAFEAFLREHRLPSSGSKAAQQTGSKTGKTSHAEIPGDVNGEAPPPEATSPTVVGSHVSPPSITEEGGGGGGGERRGGGRRARERRSRGAKTEAMLDVGSYLEDIEAQMNSLLDT